MTTDTGAVVDQLWASALGRILPGGETASLRADLGDQIDLFILQAATSRLVSTNPGFSRVLYTAAYQSAERNAYFIIRRLGMPSDFFWKFDQWSDGRAFETLQKVIDRIFSALLEHHSAGRMAVESVDVDRGRIELSFTDCAECRGASTSRPACFFHAGTFAGILGSMLDREMQAIEVSCSGTGDGPCRFLIGEATDRRIGSNFNEVFEGALVNFSAPPKDLGSSALQSPVDVGYYQLLLGTAFVPNMDVLESACLETGRIIGHEIAEQIRSASSGSQMSVPELFSGLRYMRLDISEQPDGATVVRAADAPESLGPLSRSAVVPIFCGEIESLLNGVAGTRLKFESVDREGESLVLRFIPEV